MVDPSVVLSVVAKGLAVPLSEIARELGLSVPEVKETLQGLTERHLVKPKAPGKGQDVVYFITAEGAREVERCSRRGISFTL